jgi:hypothetical protein
MIILSPQEPRHHLPLLRLLRYATVVGGGGAVLCEEVSVQTRG